LQHVVHENGGQRQIAQEIVDAAAPPFGHQNKVEARRWE
jgi:hypothetical protein